MKKLIFSASLVLALSLAACGDEKNKSKPAEEEQPAPEEKEVVDSDIGKLTIEYKNKEVNYKFTTGTFNGTINALQVGTLKVAEEYKEMLDNILQRL